MTPAPQRIVHMTMEATVLPQLAQDSFTLIRRTKLACGGDSSFCKLATILHQLERFLI